MTSNQSEAYDLIKSIGYIMNKLSNYKPEFVRACIRCFNRLYRSYDAGLANSVALYVCAKAYGYKPRICYGLCNIDNHMFYHAWLEIDDTIIDLTSYAIMNYYPAFRNLFNKVNTPYIGDYQNATPITYNKFKKDDTWRSSPISCVEYFKYIDEYIMQSPNGCMIPFVLDCLDKPNNLGEITNMLNILNRDKFEI